MLKAVKHYRNLRYCVCQATRAPRQQLHVCTRSAQSAAAEVEHQAEHPDADDILPTTSAEKMNQERRNYEVYGNLRGERRVYRRRMAYAEEAPPQPWTEGSVSGVGGVERMSMADQYLTNVKRRFDKKIFDMDQLIRRHNRVQENFFLDALHCIEADTIISPQEAALLLRIAGSYIQEVTAEERIQYVETVWKILKQHGVEMDISYYNLLLSLYLENRHDFDVTEFLDNLKTEKVEPNRVTYQRLIAHNCLNGNMDGASKILAIMKEEQMPVNEYVFNALIFGHLKNGEEDKAKELIELMKKSSGSISVDTYCTMMRAHAERGEIDKMEEIFSELDKMDLDVDDGQIHRIILSLVTGGQEKHVEQFLERSRKERGYYKSTVNLCYRLITMGAVDAAYTVLSSLQGGGVDEPGQFFLRAVAKRGLPVDKVIEICDRMIQDNLHGTPLDMFVPIALSSGYQDAETLIRKFIPKMKGPMRSTLFWPLLVKFGKEKDVAGVDRVLALMKENKCTVTFDTWARWIFPYVHEIWSMEDAVAVGNKYGMGPEEVLIPYLCWCLETGRSSEIAKALETYPDIDYDRGVNYLRGSFCAGLFSANEVVPIISLLKKIVDSCGEEIDSESSDNLRIARQQQAIGLVDGTVREMLWLRFPEAKTKEIFKIMSEEGLCVSHQTAEEIRSRLSDRLDNEMGILLFSITETGTTFGGRGVTFRGERGTMTRKEEKEKLMKMLNRMESGQLNWASHIVRRMIMLCNMDDEFDQIERLLEAAKKGGVNLDSPMMLNAQIAYYSKKGDAHNAVACYDKLVNEYTDFVILDSIIVGLGACLVRNGKPIQDVVELLTQHRENKGKGEGDVRYVYDLIDAACKQESGSSLSMAKDLANLVISLEYSSPMNRVFAPIVSYYLEKEDLSGAVDYFEQVVETHKRSPLKEKIFELAMKKNDRDLLQKIYDIAAHAFGELNTSADLAMVLIDNGKVEHARKIFGGENYSTPPLKLKFFAEQAQKRGKAYRLEIWLDLEKKMQRNDRNMMYLTLLNIYKENNDYQKALDLWTKMQEDNMWPATPEIHTLLAKILKDNGQTVPFAVPTEKSALDDMQEEAVWGEAGAMASSDSLLKEALQSGNLNRAFQMVQDEARNFSSLSYELVMDRLIKENRIEEASSFLQDLMKKKKLEREWLIKAVFQKLAEKGNLDELKKFGALISREMRPATRFDRLMVEAAVNGGRVDEIMREKTVSELAVTDMMYILNKHPEFQKKFHKEALSLRNDQEKDKIIGVLWSSAMVRGKLTEADKLLAESPGVYKIVRLQDLCTKGKELEENSMLKRLLDLHKNDAIDKRGLIISFLIGHAMDKKNLDGAVEWVRHAENNDVTINFLKRPILTALKMELEKEGRTVPFILPTAENRRIRDLRKHREPIQQ